MGQYDSRPYEVGKGKPPKEHRWPKGQSGNPRGRRRQDQPDASLSEMMAAILEERVEVTVAGRTRRMTLKEAGLRQLANDFAYGPTLQRRKTLEALFRIGALDAVAAPQDHSIPEERIEAFIQQLAAEALSDQEREEWMRENGLARPVDNPVG